MSLLMYLLNYFPALLNRFSNDQKTKNVKVKMEVL